MRGALNWLTQNLVSVQWLSRYLACARVRWGNGQVGASAYQSQIGWYERGFDVHERRRGKARWIRFGGSGDHDGGCAWRKSETRINARMARTRQLCYALCIGPSFTVPVLDDSNVHAECLHKVDDVPESVHQGCLSLTHVPRAAMHCQRAHASPYDPLDELFRLLLSRQQTNLCRYGDLGGKLSPQRRQDGAQQIRVGEQRGAHARMRAERFRTTAIEIDARDVLYDGLCGLDGEFGGGGADLVDEIGFFDRVGGEDGAGFAVVGDDAGVRWTGMSGWTGRGGGYLRSTTRCVCNMALSTISGPQTRDAPCLRAVSRVGTASGQSTTQQGTRVRRTGARADHRGEKDAILERVGREMGEFETFERARRGGTGQHDSHPLSDSRSHAQAQVHVDTPRAHPRLDPAYACLARALSSSLTPPF